MSRRATGRRGSRRTWAASVAAAVLAAATGLGLAPVTSDASAAGRAADPTAAPTTAPTLTVRTLNPVVAKPGGTLRVTGTVSSGAESLASAIVRLRVAQSPVAVRGQLGAISDGAVTPLTTTVASESRATVNQDAGTSREWSLSVDLDALGLGAAGAYPLVISLDSAVSGLTLDKATTFVSWYPDDTQAQPTRVVWTVPLVGTPARDADGVFLDDRTAASISAGGRLRTLLDAAGGTNVSWVVDPELLEAVSDMADGYEVRDENGDVRSGGAANAAAAARFLADVKARLAQADVSSLGYADPDVNALERADLADDVTLATTKGPTLAEEILGRRVRSDFAWPPGDAAERSTLATLRAAGTESVLLADTAFPVDPTVPYTPTGLDRLPVGGGALTAVFTDSGLDAVVGAPSAEGGDALARARYLAETLLITQQRPSESRTVVVAPPRLWDVDGVFARDVMTLGGRVPWLTNQSLGGLLAQDPPDVVRGPITYPEAARKAELSKAQLEGARQLGEGIETFSGVLADPAETATRYTAAQLRTVSAAFRSQRAVGARLLDAVEADLERDRAKVRVISRGTVRLSGTSGQVPITVANDLDQGVVVRVRLVPSSTVKLRIDQPGEIRLGPHKKETIDVDARAATSGTVPVDVVLLTRDGEPYGDAVTLQVRSTAYSRVGLVIVIVALAALLVLVTARLVRRARAGDAPAEPLEGADEVVHADDEPTDPEPTERT